MRLLVVSVLSLLAGGSCAYAAAVSGYPYRAEPLAYIPARGEFPVVNAITPGYVRYLDQQGVEHLIGYQNTQPAQSRRITNEEYLNQLVKGSLSKDETDSKKACEEHFRLWSIQQYDQYRHEIECLKAAGQEPTADLLAKIRTLEAIIIAARSGANIGNTQTQQIREEHLRLWNEARLAAQQTASAEIALKPTIYLRYQSAELAKDVPTQIAIVGETAEQKKAREEHLRIYQAQLEHVQQLQEAAAAKPSDSTAHLTKEARFAYVANQGVEQNQQQAHAVKIIEHLSYLEETPEVQRAKAEHFRLWNEAKLRAQKEGYKYENEQYQSGLLLADRQYDNKNAANTYKSQKDSTQEKLLQTEPQASNLEQRQNLKSDIASKTLTPVHDTPEVQLAKTEHLRIVDELQKKAQFIADAQPDSNNSPKAAIQQPATTQPLQLYGPAANEQLATTKSNSANAIYRAQPQAYAAVQETAEVQRAREEHLKLVKEAHLKASQYHTQSTQIVSEPTLYVAAELVQPAEEHKVEELRLRAEEAKQREAEISAEAERIKEEERLKVDEMLRLQQEEQRRQEQERLDQTIENTAAQLYAETPQLAAASQPKETLAQLIQTQIKTGGEGAVTYDIREKESYAGNPYLLRFTAPSANQIGTPIATTAYYVGAQQPTLQQQNYGNPGYYHLRDAGDSYIKLDNPYFLHYITNQQGGKETLAPADAAYLASALSNLNQVQQIPQPIPAAIAGKPIAPSTLIAPISPISPFAPVSPILPIAPIAPNAAAMKIDYGRDSSLAALEQATRDHFRAHEIALEQLRLANQKQPAQKDCN